MEVIGAASSIITVIEVIGTVISICYDYQRGLRRYPKDVIKIIQELQSLRNILERLADIANSQNESASIALPALVSLTPSGGPLELCRVELEQLQLNLTPAEGRLKQIGRALTWPLKGKDVQKALGTLSRQRGIIQLALTADQATVSSAIRNVTSRTEGNLISLTHEVQAAAIEQRHEQIFRWLAAPDPSSNHNKACQAKQQETGRWLLESLNYRNWRDHRKTFLWLHGIPGCGKTVLCSTIIDDIASMCQGNSRRIVAYHYFDFNESKRRTCEGLARSLVTQLFGQGPKSSKIMDALFAQSGDGHREPTIQDLGQALRELTEYLEDIYFIVDALDECINISAVISLFGEFRGWRKQNLHILVTSRKEVDIERGIRLLITDQVQIQNALVDADIKILVRECLRSDPDLSQWSEAIKAEVEKTLGDGSRGMFRWAVCQLETLRKCIKPSALRKALASLPTTLDETYERILCGIEESHAEDALKVLQWLAFSARPLELQEVAEATAITLDDLPRFDPEDRLRHPTDILAVCSSLISISTRQISLPFRPCLRGSPSRLSPSLELVSTYEDACSADDRPGGASLSIHDPVVNGSTLSCSMVESVSIDKGASSIRRRLETEPPDDEASTVLSEGHLNIYEVRLAHDSVKEFLVSERIRRTKAAFYSINDASTHLFLARSCLAYLMHFKQPLGNSTTEYLSEYPLLRYSAQEWEFHVSNSGDLNRDARIDSVLKLFFLAQNYSFANWLVMPFGPYHGNFQDMEEVACDTESLRPEGRLYHASRLGLNDICKILLEQGVNADPRTESNTGLVKSLSTPLQIAAYEGHEPVVRLLLDHGANVNQRSVHASTLDCAVAEGRESVVRLLIERGAKIAVEAAVSYYGLRGLTTLVVAARAGHVSIVKLILDNATYPNPRQSYSEAYREAVAQGHQDVAELLLEYGADPDSFAGSNGSDGSDDEFFEDETRRRS